MAFDFGQRRIGVAVGQHATGTTQGIGRVANGERGVAWRTVGEMVGAWRPAGFVVGLALDEDGGETAASRLARAFGSGLAKRFGLPVYWVNERLTSDAAQHLLKQTVTRGRRFSRRKQENRDLLAAELILRSYLESTTTRRRRAD